jgi:energy-coupling factor transport system permease protein
VIKNISSSVKTHPLTWWLLAIAFIISASMSTSSIYLFTIASFSLLLVWVFRERASYAKSIGFYLRLALAVVFIRIIFRIIFNMETDANNPLIVLPALTIRFNESFVMQLLGPISRESFIFALTDGLRLAAIVLAVGMASSLANPRKLLRSTPGALYEIASAVSIAINLAPQLITSLNRVKKARSLRGQSKGIKTLPGLVIPVLEDSIDQTMSLAASMSSRGFGRRGNHSKLRTILIRLCGFMASLLLSFGVFLLLVSPENQLLDWSLLTSGVLCVFLYIKMSALGANRTKYRKEPWHLADLVVLSLALAVFLTSFMGVVR